MSKENENNTGRVLDDGQIDKRLKDRILDARDRVAGREDDTFVGARLTGDVKLSHSQLVGIWATSVRQFLRTIEPLLRSDEIENSRHYYHEIPIYEDTLRPPDGETVVLTTGTKDGVEENTEQIRWSLFYNDNISNRKLTRENSLFDSGFEPPEPQPIKLRGLKSIIEQDLISANWDVVLNPDSPPAEKTHIAKPEISQPLGKPTLEYAVRKADEFLHDAGISPDVGGSTEVDPI
jgi:hypothetical protein